jgi:hypothetical protein
MNRMQASGRHPLVYGVLVEPKVNQLRERYDAVLQVRNFGDLTVSHVGSSSDGSQSDLYLHF